MRVNVKKPIRLKNRTNYFIPGKDKTYVEFSSPSSYESRSIKIEGYETRLYWQYKYCEEHNGQTFFYTLTYNDKAMPHKYGMNCFDYEDLRQLLTGGFRKMLLRKYGTMFKYFVGAELGDGKGERGMHNNPHYHILFFLEPGNNSKFPYKKISSEDFRHLVRLYWQGHDQDTDGWKDYREFRYGVAKEGENCGLVSDFRAVQYVAKYVSKDVKLSMNEENIDRKLRCKYYNSLRRDESVYEDFYHTRIYELFNTPLNSKHTKWSFNDDELGYELCPELYIDYDGKLVGPGKISAVVEKILHTYNLRQEWKRYIDSLIDVKVKEGINEWRNRYCNKCRISQGVGDYAISHIQDKLNPLVQVPSKKGLKNRPISMYYYRKLYTDVVKDPFNNPIRVLNDLGIQYKCSRLSKSIQKMADKTSSQFKLLLDNRDLFNKMVQSDVNCEVDYSYDHFQRYINTYIKDIQNIIKKYAEYKLVYQDRFFKVQSIGFGEDSCFPVIDVSSDYKRFITPSYFSCKYSNIRLTDFIESNGEGYLPYYTHPYFLQYRSLFDLFDLCANYFFVQGDDRRQREAEELAAVKRFHTQSRMKEFYSGFGIS